MGTTVVGLSLHHKSAVAKLWYLKIMQILENLQVTYKKMAT
jgi:hypothetical protein